MSEEKYKTIEDIPPLIFSNRMLTESPSKELLEFLDYMEKTHPNDLEFLWRRSQLYKNYGGGWQISFVRWLKKLRTDLDKQLGGKS